MHIYYRIVIQAALFILSLLIFLSCLNYARWYPVVAYCTQRGLDDSGPASSMWVSRLDNETLYLSLFVPNNYLSSEFYCIQNNIWSHDIYHDRKKNIAGYRAALLGFLLNKLYLVIVFLLCWHTTHLLISLKLNYFEMWWTLDAYSVDRHVVYLYIGMLRTVL